VSLENLCNSVIDPEPTFELLHRSTENRPPTAFKTLYPNKKPALPLLSLQLVNANAVRFDLPHLLGVKN
jgi:hypothetical protein